MNSKKVAPAENSLNLDENGLNEESTKIAKYFYCINSLNSNDIKLLKKKYLFFKKNSDDSIVTISQFILYAELPDIPLVEYLFSCFKNNCLEWNDFFQFVIYYSLCPMSSYLYTILHIRQNYDGLINLDLLVELYSLVETEKEIKYGNNVEIFHDLDLNKDNFINFSQFCKFFNKSFPSCDLFYIFRIKLLAYFFPDSKYRTILNRRKKITDIKDYQSKHNDKLPNDSSSSCVDVIINNLFDTNPNRYDYDCDLTDISFYDITAMIIRKYNPLYKRKKRKKQSSRFLNKLLHYVVLNEIDSYYMEYYKAIPPEQPILPPPFLQPLSSSLSQQQQQISGSGNLQMLNRKVSVVSCNSTDSCSSILRKSSFGVLKQRKPTYHQINSRSSIIAFQLYKRSIQLSQPPLMSNEVSVSTPTTTELPQAMSDSNDFAKRQMNIKNSIN